MIKLSSVLIQPTIKECTGMIDIVKNLGIKSFEMTEDQISEIVPWY